MISGTPKGQTDAPSAARNEKRIARDYPVLLNALQGSLAASQSALLRRDLAALEQCTREQFGLCGELRGVLQDKFSDTTSYIGQATERLPKAVARIESRFSPDLHSQELALRQALRVYLAVLARSRHQLRVLANMLAGPSIEYGAPSNQASQNTSPQLWRRAG